MALSSALFSGISGLTNLGNAMQIIGDNISNLNTIGFKSSSFTFQDLLSQSMFTRSGTSQVGRGTAIADVYASFEQGSFETTGNTTDLAIGGDGFFAVRESGSNSLYYTRAGNFRFNNDGQMINPEGYVVQGWMVDEDGNIMGSTTDIAMTSFTSQPQPTDSVSVITNLDKDQESTSVTLSDAWDATNDPPIASTAYGYQTTVKAYDSLGSTHDVTIYYDKGASNNVWEYLVTCPPDEDLRTGITGTSSAGLLARGTITFNESSGTITGIDMSRLTATGPQVWTAGTLNADGYYEFGADFLGGTATGQDIALDIGVRHNGASFAPDSLSTTQYASASTTVYQSATGYGAGDLQGVDVDVDGLITGVYSNGQVLPLYKIALAKFQSVQGLHKMGGNLYRETRESGSATTSLPGSNGLGSIAPNSLEQSNVDMAAEFVKMITTQRNFQANSKIITTTDTMLSELINLKR
ncbi:MAG: flagellar hook protein FlgE [Deltaproteobacteria bacterium]|nr:flagellar hook protein FlgE [Deltaproteobacteria bacterium]